MTYDNRGPDSRSISTLLSDLVHDLGELVRSEGRLVRSEINESGRKLAAGAEILAAGAIILLLAAIVLLQALVIALAHWVGPTWAAIIVGGVLFIIGTVLMLRGKNNLSVTTLLPERAVEQTSRDAQLAKDQLK